jgi:hypothetical protein
MGEKQYDRFVEPPLGWKSCPDCGEMYIPGGGAHKCDPKHRRYWSDQEKEASDSGISVGWGHVNRSDIIFVTPDWGSWMDDEMEAWKIEG